MTASDIERRFTLACEIAREGGAMMLAAFKDRKGGPVHSFKGTHDYLTETDAAVEKMVRGRIAAAFPADDFLGEESVGKEAKTYGSDLWVVDPIDGTANFARGIPHFCISIAFMRAGVPEIGVIHDPSMNETFAAQRGKGAACNGKPMKASAIGSMGEAIVEAGWSHRRPNAEYVAIVGALYDAGAQVRRSGSGALGLAYVAAGRQDGYCELHINAWDCLAGIVLVREAGGWINDFLAGNGLHDGNPILGCTTALQDPLSRIVKLGPPR